MTVQHECPWVGECRCVEDVSLCTCGHQKPYHARLADSGPTEHEQFLFRLESDDVVWDRCEVGTAVDLKHEDPCSCTRFKEVSE